MDTLNSELAQVIRTESDLSTALANMQASPDVSDERLDEIKQQLTSAEMQKDNLLKKLDHLDEEVRKKKKELGQKA